MIVVQSSFAEFLDRVRARVDSALDRWLSRPPECPAIIADAMRYSVFAGGKRLRPVLTLAAAETTGGDDGAAIALPAACAIELIHTYSLIHDDLPSMDNDTMRRGRPTLHTVVGEGIAILAGDGLHAEAFTLLAREPAPGLELGLELARRQLRVARLVGEAAGPAGMVGGQAVDLQAAGRARGGTLALDVNDLKAMHARKTGALIRASAVSGAIMAGAPDEIVGAIDRYAGDVGLGFQIVDDILDVEGDLAELGKTVGKDAAGDKPTYPKFYGVEQSRRLAMECVNRALQTLSDANLTGGHLGAIAEWVIARRS